MSTLPPFGLVNATVVCSSYAKPKYFQSNNSDDSLPMKKKKKKRNTKPNIHGASPSPPIRLDYHLLIVEQLCIFIVFIWFSLQLLICRKLIESWNYF